MSKVPTSTVSRRNNFSMRFFGVLVMLVGLSVSVSGQTPNGFLDFGTTANGTTATTGNTGFGGVRVGTGNGGFTIQNSGQSIGTNAELRGIAPSSASINSIGLTSAEYGTAATTFTISFEIYLSGGASGTWYFFVGNGSSFGTAQSVGFTGNESFTGLRWAYGASSAITTNNRAAGSWNATGITGTPFIQGAAYFVTIVGNNSTSTVNYGASQSVAANTYDLWVNGVLAGNDLAKAQLAANTSINAFRFYSESSTGNVATIALDNIRWYNTCVLPPTHLAFVNAPSTGFTNTNLNQFTVEARSGSNTGPVSTAFSGALTLAKASGTGAISGSLSPSAVSGVATYSDVKFDAADTYTMSVSGASPIVSASSGNVVVSTSGTPMLSVGNLSGFGDVCINNTSGHSSFTITGSSLTTDNVTIAALSGYTFSATWDGAYTSTLSITQAGGSFSQDIFVKLTPTTAQSYNGNIIISGGGADNATRSVTGTGVNSAPTVTTTSPVTSLTSTTVTLSGNVEEVGCQSISARGMCYGTSANPDINGTKSTESGGAGSYSSNISGLSPNTLYYFRAYATSSAGTSYGSDVTFTTLTPTISVGTITGFSNQTVNTISTEKSYAVSGVNLISDVTITPPAGFEVSLTSGSGFVASPSTISLSPSSGTLASTTIFVRFKPTVVSAYSSININHTATSAVAKTVAVSGTGVAPTDPTSVSAAAASYNQINLSFTPNGSNNVVVAFNTTNTFGTPTGSYSVSDAISGGGTVLYKGTGSSYNHTALSANTVYYYKVWTVDASNFYSAGVSTNATTNNLIAPVAISATNSSATGFTANWDAVSGASEYKLDVATNSNFSSLATIATEGFENVVTLFSQSNGVYYSGNSASGDRPASSPFAVAGSYSYGVSNGTAVLTSNNINTSNYTDNQLSFRLASFSLGSTGNGADVGDIVTVEISPDGTNYYSTIRILGNANANWAFSATGVASTSYDGDAIPDDFQPAGGGNRTTDGYATITVTGLPSASTLKVRITLLNNSTSELWVIDDFKVTGNLSDVLSNYNNLSVSSTSQAVTGLTPNTTYYYRVRAVGGNSTSANSNTITAVTTSTIPVASGDVNAGDLPVCTTCDVTVASGSHLTISDSKEYNSVTAAPGAKLTITGSLAGSLTLESSATATATLIDSYSTPTITATVKQHVTAGRNWYMTSPLSETGYSTILNGGDSIVAFNESLKKWEKVSTGNLIKGRGYISVASATKGTTGTIDFNGTTNSGDITVTGLTRTESGSNRGFNLVGNPYPSYLNWQLVDTTAGNLTSSVWYRTKTTGGDYTFDSYNGKLNTATTLGAKAVTNRIPPMQAFWVRVKTTAGGSIAFNNAMRLHREEGVNTNSLKAPVKNTEFSLVRLRVSNNSKADEALICFHPDAVNSVDGYDTYKMSNNNSDIPEIYTLIGNEKFVINSFKELTNNTEIPLSFATGKANNFTIKASEIKNFDAEAQIVLKDKLQNAEFNLTSGDTYEFNSEVVSNANRFSIIFRTSGSANGLDNTQLNTSTSVFVNANGELIVNTAAPIKYGAYMSVYNAIGQQISIQPMTSSSTIATAARTAGVYWVKISNDGEVVTRKVIVR